MYRQGFLVGGPGTVGMQHTGLELWVKMVRRVEVAAMERPFWSLLGPLNPPPPLTVWGS